MKLCSKHYVFNTGNGDVFKLRRNKTRGFCSIIFNYYVEFNYIVIAITLTIHCKDDTAILYFYIL